jgi:aminopeptidase N
MNEIGEEAYFAALTAYYTDHLFGVSAPNDLQRAFEQAAGRHLGAFWRYWFEEANGLEDFPRQRYDEAMELLG